MSTHKYIDRICCGAMALAVLLAVIFMNGESLGIQAAASSMGYEDRLFDTSAVHTLDIVMDDWDAFLETCAGEEYADCTVVIDGETYANVAIRAKGNTSLTQVENYGNDRYSFKIEFDHYDSGLTYHGLDKLSLNNIIQDNTYLKDYLTYQMMGWFGVAAPLCSYVYITVNGEDWGLYLAVEGVEESFLERNYGSDYGELYKPDSIDMGGSRGNGGGFDMDDWQPAENASGGDFAPPENLEPPGDGEPPEDRELPEDFAQDFSGRGGGGGMGGFSMGSDDVSLIYTDDDYDSYQNIFDNAKTDITDEDRDRLIASLKRLNAGEDIEEVVDVDQVIRYFVVHNFVCNFDSYTGSMIHNYYLYEKDGRLSMIPWDYNLAFGGFQDQSDATTLVNYPIDDPVSGGTVESRPMLAWIFADETYTELYHQYFAEFLAEYFDSGYFAEMLDQVETLIAPYVEKDPTKFCTYEEFQTSVDTLREFCLLRAESVSGQLEGTIPATSEGQAAGSASLIDASHIVISDMGSMNGGGMGGGRGGFDGLPGDGQFPVLSEDAQSGEEDTAQEETTQSQETSQGWGTGRTPPSGEAPAGEEAGSLSEESLTTPEAGGAAGERAQAPESGGNQTPPGFSEDTGQGGGSDGFPGGSQVGADVSGGQETGQLLLLAGSALVLAIGLLIAALYRKRA